MRFPLLLILVVLVASLAVSLWSHPLREAAVGDDPARQLARVATEDRDLAAALGAADRHDPAPLVQWLNRADPLQRQHVGLLIVKSLAQPPADDRAVYRQRHRLLPFVSVSTGNDDLDHELDNMLAYILVAGTDQPQADEVALARTLADRLVKPARDASQHEMLDTIGCVRFVAGEAAAAREAFSQAVDIAQAAKAPEKLLDLYRRRKAASERLATNAKERLPLDW